MSSVDVHEHDNSPHALAASRPSAWRLHAAFAATLAGFGAIYAGTFGSLIYIWAHSGLFEYAFLILPVCLFLIWLRRERLRGLEKAPKPIGLAAVGLFCLIWLAGAAADVNLVRQFSVIAMIPCLVFTFYGAAVTRALIFPLGYLFFALPVGDFLVGPLQDITARLSVIALHLTNVPVFVDGRILMTRAGTWHVEEACSGIKFFFATIAFGVLYANLFYQSWRRRLIFVACAMIVPIIANGLRVYFTILIGEHFGMQYATGTDHMIFGWQFFGTVLVLLFFAGWPWHEPEAQDMPHDATVDRSITGLPKAAAMMCATLALLVLAPLWLHTTAASPSSIAPVRSGALPDSLGGMSRASEAGSPQASEIGPGLVFKNADAYAQARYGAADAPVQAVVAVYGGAPGATNELITHGNRLFDSSVWKQVPDSRQPRMSGLGAFEALQLARRNGEGRWLVWYVYRVGDRTTHSKAVVKMWQLWDRLLGRAAPAMVVALAAPVGEDGSSARERMERAAADLTRWINRNPGGDR